MSESQQSKSEPPRKSVIIILGVIVLGLVLVLVLRRSSSHPNLETASTTSNGTTANNETVAPSSEAPPVPASPREVIASAPVSAVPPVQTQTAPPASPFARQLVNGLVQVNMTNGPLTPEKLAAWQQALQQLTNAGPAAVPAIREFLQTKQDANFDSLGGAAVVGEPSLRLAMVDALAKIGGPEATALLADTLRATTNPREIAAIAANLERLVPGDYRTAAVDAARAALAEAASGKLPGTDVAALFTVLQQYAGADALQDFQNANRQWSYYSAIALGGIPDGAGIPALTQMAQPDSANRNSRSAALQVLAQMAPDSAEARAAFLEQAKTDLPPATWIKIGALLSGEQLQIGNRDDAGVPDSAVKSTYRLPNQNFFTTSVLERLSADQLTQRIQLIDQILAETKQAAAVDALQRARNTLQARAQ